MINGNSNTGMTQAEALVRALTIILPEPKMPKDDLDVVTVAGSTDWLIPPLSDLCDQRWREAFAATKLAEALAWLCYEKPLKTLVPSTRAGLKTFAEELVENAIKDFGTPTVQLESIRSFQQSRQQADGYRDENFDGLTADEAEERR